MLYDLDYQSIDDLLANTVNEVYSYGPENKRLLWYFFASVGAAAEEPGFLES